MNKPGFIYFECPVCEFSSVQDGEFDVSHDLCPVCAEDNGRDVAMTWREARDSDKAEGHDARKETIA